MNIRAEPDENQIVDDTQADRMGEGSELETGDDASGTETETESERSSSDDEAEEVEETSEEVAGRSVSASEVMGTNQRGEKESAD
jgi:hypothetical protein